MKETTLVNAIPIEVAHRDGTTSTVVCRELQIVERYQYLHLLAAYDTPAIVALCAKKPLEWVNTLTAASFKVLAKKAYDLNFPAAIDLIESDPAMAAKLAPLLISMLGVEGQLDALPPEVKAATMQLARKSSEPPASSPTPASSDSVAETGSDSSA